VHLRDRKESTSGRDTAVKGFGLGLEHLGRSSLEPQATPTESAPLAVLTRYGDPKIQVRQFFSALRLHK